MGGAFACTRQAQEMHTTQSTQQVSPSHEHAGRRKHAQHKSTQQRRHAQAKSLTCLDRFAAPPTPTNPLPLPPRPHQSSGHYPRAARRSSSHRRRRRHRRCCHPSRRARRARRPPRYLERAKISAARRRRGWPSSAPRHLQQGYSTPKPKTFCRCSRCRRYGFAAASLCRRLRCHRRHRRCCCLVRRRLRSRGVALDHPETGEDRKANVFCGGHRCHRRRRHRRPLLSHSPRTPLHAPLPPPPHRQHFLLHYHRRRQRC